MRTITAPGIEIREIDRSGYSPAMTGSTCYIMGFSDKGEPYKPMEFTSRAAWVNYYGEPDTEAERYFYAAVCEVLNQNGRLYCARLPYDNESFEKLVSFKYSVDRVDTALSDESTQYGSAYKAISEQDNEIQTYAKISTTAAPVTIDLATVDEYRTDENKVTSGTFVIVDTTGSTYGKVQEDSRKGILRENIGIVPVVTTAANAMYAQSLISLPKNHVDYVKFYEPLAGSSLKTLVHVSKDGKQLANDGLSSIDFVKRINTEGKWFTQTCDFTQVILSGDPIDDPIANLTSYDSSLSSFLAYGEVSAFANGEVNPENFITCGPVAVLTAQWEEVNKLPGGYLGADHDVANPESFNAVYSDDGKYVVGWNGVCLSATKRSDSDYEVHGVDGDDSVPDTLALDAANYFSSIQPASDGVGFDPEHLKDIGVVVYKTWLDPSEGNKVSFEPVEAFCGSLFKDDKDPNTGVTKFIDTIINTQSHYINFFSNCFNSTADKKWYKDECDILISMPSEGASLGFYEQMTKEDISISKSIFDGMNKALDKVSDINERDIDIVCDAGLANIASYLKAIYGDKGPYDLTVTDDLGNSLLGMWKAVNPTDAPVKIWKTVEQKFDNFCKNVRKDCMFIADGLRPLVLQGQKKIIRDSKPANTIDANIIPFLKTITGLNTSYCGLYMDWFEQADDYTGDFFWCPPSIKAMGVYVNTDVNFNYWDAPAGLNRGLIAATDVAFSPTIKQAGSIYEKCINYAVNYPNDGIVLEGQRTTQVKPSAFDRVNVRRLFCRLERMAYKISRYFLYEGNTAYTRQRLVDALDPYFKEAKVGGGIYDYKIVCDESNNTPSSIDRNELHVSIGIKPVKSVEFIIVDFVAASTGASWQEVGL